MTIAECSVSGEAQNGRKRSKLPESWNRNAQKRQRLQGLEYKKRNNNIVQAKQFRNRPCGCKKNCHQQITPDQRQSIMNSFFALNDHVKQNIFLHGSVQSLTVKRRRPNDKSKPPKQTSFVYFIRTEREDIKVCKQYFLETFQISNHRLNNSVSKQTVAQLIDKRGRHSPGNKIDKSHVVSHINSFPAFSSHYTRNHNPRRLYLNPDLTIKKMYEMYLEKCQHEKVIPVKESYYYNVFSNDFNLHFKQPLKDTCQQCDSLQMKIDHGDEQNQMSATSTKAIHQESAERARNELRSDKELSSNSTYVFTFDLEKALAFPKLTTSVAYYKRNLYCYCFGCHSFNQEKNIFLYFWPETEGSRGSQEIASCLVQHIKNQAKTHKKIIMYSDCCTGQNRNIKTVLSLMKLVQSNEIEAESIEMKFLVSGHSYLPNDADFAIIESSAKKQQHIYSPCDWLDLIKNCKQKDKFNVVEMSRTEFKSTKSLENAITNRKKTTTKQPVNWLTFRHIKLDRSKPYCIEYKQNFDDSDFSCLNIKKSRPGIEIPIETIEQELLYPEERCITIEKKKDMLDLIKFIPPIYHNYYINLKTSITVNDEDVIFNN